MDEYDKIYPEYGFAQHKGYGTAQHIEALKKYGPCPIHRPPSSPCVPSPTILMCDDGIHKA